MSHQLCMKCNHHRANERSSNIRVIWNSLMLQFINQSERKKERKWMRNDFPLELTFKCQHSNSGFGFHLKANLGYSRECISMATPFFNFVKWDDHIGTTKRAHIIKIDDCFYRLKTGGMEIFQLCMVHANFLYSRLLVTIVLIFSFNVRLSTGGTQWPYCKNWNEPNIEY